PAPGRAPRGAGVAGGPGRAGHAAGAGRRAHAVPAPGGGRRSRARVLPAPLPRQGRGHRRRVGHRRLEQPRPVEPVAEPGGERARARPRLRRRPRGAPAGAAGTRLPPGGQGADAAVAALARAHPPPAVPLPAPLPGLGRVAARAYAGDHGAAPGRRRPRRMRARRPWLRRGPARFLRLLGWLLLRYARGVAWPAVGEVLRGYTAAQLALVVALALLSYATYACYDLGARRYAGHALSTRRVLAIAATCYAFALSLGALVGGAGLRLRLYARSGLPTACIGRVVAFSVTTNWLGYVALAGVVFAAGAVAPPPAWGLGGGLLRALGMAMVLLALAYPGACARWRGRVFHFRGHHFRLPTPALGALQVLLAAANWSLMGTLVWLLLGTVAWPLVLATLLLSAVASALVHVPAGLGVIEAVFLAVLGPPGLGLVDEPRLLAALLAYRAVYYLLPLSLALAFYLAFEVRGGRSPWRATAR